MKAKQIARAIRIVWESLDSHLDDTHDPLYDKVKSKIARDHIGDKAFHKKCVKEYAEVIKTLTELL